MVLLHPTTTTATAKHLACAACVQPLVARRAACPLCRGAVLPAVVAVNEGVAVAVAANDTL
jgi:hypothetical protein